MPDNIPVRPAAIGAIMERVVESYSPEGRVEPDKGLPKLKAALGTEKALKVAKEPSNQRNYAKIPTRARKAWLYTSLEFSLLSIKDLSGLDILRKALSGDVDNSRLNYRLCLGTS